VHERVRREVDQFGAQLARGVSIGVHKRVETPGTALYQGAGSSSVFSCADFVRAVEVLISRLSRSPTRIFLATDDANSEDEFRAAFPERLCVRDGIQRVSGGVNPDGTLNEVHIRSPHNPRCTVRDAADVLIDALLLARCHWLVHMDSNVTSAVSLINPRIKMLHVAELLH